MKMFQVMLFNAIVLIALGIYGYSLPPHSPTALISAVIGLILLALVPAVRKEKSWAAHIASGLTGLSVITFFIVGFLRGNMIIIAMAVVSLIAMMFYISDFTRRKRERETNK